MSALEPMEPVFEDPPPPGGGRRPADEAWTKVAVSLIERSGEWARIAELDTASSAPASLYSRIRNSRGVWAGHEWQVTTRGVGRGKESRTHVYVRHLRPLTSNDGGDDEQ